MEKGGSCLSRGSRRGRDGGTGQARRATSALRDEKMELQEVGACRGSGAAWDRPGEGGSGSLVEAKSLIQPPACPVSGYGQVPKTV